MILYNTELWYYTFGQFHGNVTLVTKFLIYIFENNRSYVQNEAHFRRVRWELNYFTKKCNILTRFLEDFYVTNLRLLWKCPFRLQRYSFITTLFFRSLWWRYNQVLLYYLPPMHAYSKRSHSFRFSDENFVCISICLFSAIHTTCPTHLILLHLIIPVMFGVDYNVWSSSIIQFSPASCHFSLLHPNILGKLFPNSLNVCSSLNVRSQVSDPYKTTGKIIVLF
jgi:hypothetical protein